MDNQLVIRGVTTGINPINNTVAVYVDDTPWTSEGPFANPGIAPNLDTYDMQRIEVLRGPQGTLYGALALGGLVKFVTNAPDPTSFATSVQAGGSYTSGGSAGYDTHGMINMPIANDLALRLVAYDSYYPGYIDDPSRGLTNINGTHISGGRASLLFSPTSDLSIRLTAVYQDILANDVNNVISIRRRSSPCMETGLSSGRFPSRPRRATSSTTPRSTGTRVSPPCCHRRATRALPSAPSRTTRPPSARLFPLTTSRS